MSTARMAIQTEGLSKAFARRTIIREVNLQVAEGQSVAFTGPNGSGKTTLLRCLAATLRPTTGGVRWFGLPAGSDPAARRLVGVVAHRSLLYPHLTLRENLVFAARMYDVQQPARRADRLLCDVGLQLHAHQLPMRISEGMRQRLSMVRAIVHDPPILFLDEPFSGLDAAASRWLTDWLLAFRNRGGTLCFAAHDEQQVRRLADRVFCLLGGRLEEIEPSAGLPYGGVAKPARAA